MGILEELNPWAPKPSFGITTTFDKKDLAREPISLSLMPEYFEDEDENLTSEECA